jgi:hypothetical protein
MSITVKADTSEFEKTMKEYIQWSKRQPAEIVNAKLYFIALHAYNETKAATKQQVRGSLQQPSRKYPNRTLGEILTYIQLRKKGKFPRKAASLATKVEKFIKRREGHIRFLRSGWAPAMKKLDFWNRRGDISFVKRNAPKKKEIAKQYGVEKGDVTPARADSLKASGTIFNFIGEGPQASSTVQGVLLDGLQKGVDIEIASMKKHVKEKFDKKHAEMIRKGKVK